MRLIEINNRPKTFKIPVKIYEELVAHETSTLAENAEPDKVQLADELRRGKVSGASVSVPLTDLSMAYMLEVSLPKMIDIAQDNMYAKKARSINIFMEKIHHYLVSRYPGITKES